MSHITNLARRGSLFLLTHCKEAQMLTIAGHSLLLCFLAALENRQVTERFRFASTNLRTREFLKHLHDSFLNRLFDTLCVSDFVAGWAMLECVRSRATPQAVLTLRLRYLNDERSLRHWPALITNCDTRRDGIQYRRPTLIRNVHFALGPDECRQDELTVRFDFRHSLCRHLLIYRSDDYRMHHWIRPC